MKKVHIKTAVIVIGMWVTASASAHDPSEHTSQSEKPKCEAMENMDQSKMDVNDPVMQAMMKKCTVALNDSEQGEHPKSASDDENEHQTESDHSKQADDLGHH